MENKNYYYLKLKENFFESDELKILESQENGYLYSNILLKLYLKALKNDGKLVLNEYIPYNAKMLATITGHNVDIVEKAIKVFQALHLIEILDNGTIFMLDMQKMIGSISSEGIRKAKYRERINNEKEQSKTIEGQSPDILSISNSKSISNYNINKDRVVGEEKKSKHKYGEYKRVLLTDEELEKLNKEFGEAETQKAITYLDEYIEMKGAKYKSHYLVMKKWVYEAIKERAKPANNNNKSSGSKIPYNNSGYTDEELEEMERSGKMYGLCID